MIHGYTKKINDSVKVVYNTLSLFVDGVEEKSRKGMKTEKLVKRSDAIVWCILACILCFAFGVGAFEHQAKERVELANDIGYAKGMAWHADHKDDIKSAKIVDSDSMLVVTFYYSKKAKNGTSIY